MLGSGDALRIVITGGIALMALGTSLAWIPAWRFDPMIIPARLFLGGSLIMIFADPRGVGLVLGLGLATLSAMLWWQTQPEPEVPRPQLGGLFVGVVVTAVAVFAAVNGWSAFGRLPDTAANVAAGTIAAIGTLSTLAVADRSRIRLRDAVRRRFYPVEANPISLIGREEEPPDTSAADEYLSVKHAVNEVREQIAADLGVTIPGPPPPPPRLLREDAAEPDRVRVDTAVDTTTTDEPARDSDVDDRASAASAGKNGTAVKTVSSKVIANGTAKTATADVTAGTATTNGTSGKSLTNGAASPSTTDEPPVKAAAKGASVSADTLPETKQAVAKKTPAKKTPAKKATTKKPAAKTTTTKKPAANKAAAAKKSTAKKATTPKKTTTPKKKPG